MKELLESIEWEKNNENYSWYEQSFIRIFELIFCLHETFGEI